MAEWVKRTSTKGEIDRAGTGLLPWWTGPLRPITDEEFVLWRVAMNWRASHAMPLLTFRMGLTKRAKRVESDVLIAQRMKRISSVLNKLHREPVMKLSQMQDLGGCRAILSNVAAVHRLFEIYKEDSPADLFSSEGSLKCYDYIRTPKDDGYRGIHVVGRYRAKSQHNEVWNGQRIEIQLRSRLQHAFSTAVETVTTFTTYRLKFGGGPNAWKRFFSLMGSALAVREGTPLIAHTPSDHRELVKELRELSRELKVKQRLRGWADGLRSVRRQNLGKFKWLLLVLDTSAGSVRVVGFDDRKKADAAVSSLESSKNLDAVLVWVRSATDLRAAYPNYYADTGEFINALDSALKSVG